MNECEVELVQASLSSGFCVSNSHINIFETKMQTFYEYVNLRQ